MGYKISSLNSLPIIPGIDLYVFILGNQNWSGGYAEIIENNFAKLALHLGSRGAIVAAHEGIDIKRELEGHLSKVALSNKLVHELLTKGESFGLSILLMGAHPSQLSEDDLILLAPVEKIENNFGSLDRFFSELCKFAQEREYSFLERFEEKAKKGEGITRFFELKPNMFGIGVNINEILTGRRRFR